MFENSWDYIGCLKTSACLEAYRIINMNYDEIQMVSYYFDTSVFFTSRFVLLLGAC